MASQFELTRHLLVSVAERRGRMSDDTAIRRPQDASRIALEEDYEVRYWTQKWGITQDELADAVAKVGHSAAAVARHLGRSEYD